ncbi:pseudouridine synthase [endosymbiont of Ridgeia piscesae]|jgi:hypothetical protein|uniref:Uncharacterized protein n=1 Tax=endosymbiont of Ridgeia piscesae TaxID=54398 RepID=A0A0T5YV13_9GAMM|nr:pseudouridine synthase [endosymbiont of Ridgeia piscesae]KRT54396.1 hypothetical protein Ga0074115_10532 [endosymbiont of Ridgeia piscesae]
MSPRRQQELDELVAVVPLVETDGGDAPRSILERIRYYLLEAGEKGLSNQ